jgi:pyruvate formate lyase activating enzyme
MSGDPWTAGGTPVTYPECDPDAQTCALCSESSPLVAAYLGLCLQCIRGNPGEALAAAGRAHARARRLFDLPEQAPRSKGGVRCGLCAQECLIGEGQRGYCGLREVHGGKIQQLAGTPSRGHLHWYRDPLPTNCVADPFCGGHTQRGRHNLAVFYASCTANCLYCQNWHFREIDQSLSAGTSAARLASAARPETHCVCFFGGDPASQMGHAIAAGRLLAERGLAVCWETNGTAHQRLMDRAVEMSLCTGGCVKFDLKAHDDNLHRVLTGVSNRRTLDNLARAAARFDERPGRPLVVASTLLVPGYVDPEEVARIAGFIAGLNPMIPLVLLGFAPTFLMPDLPPTSVRHAEEAEAAALAAGLRTVRVGNRHLLSRDY